MASPFEITTSTNTVTLDGSRRGSAVFTVKNLTRRRVHATAQVATTPAGGEKWLTFQADSSPAPAGGTPPPSGTTPSTNPPNVRDIPIDGSTTFQINIGVPMDAAPASYTIKLTVADEIDPDDNFTTSPDVVFTVPAVVKPAPRPFPYWIIAAIIIAVIVIVVLVVVAINGNNSANAAATATAATALEAARQTSDAATALAGTQSALATATQNAVGTQNAQGTQSALNVYVGSWSPTDPNSVIKSLKIENAGNNKLTITFGTICPPNTNSCSSNRTVTNVSLGNVTYNAQQLAAGTGNTTLLIQPSNNNQLAVTVSIAGSTSVITFRRNLIILTFVGPILETTSVFINPSTINQLSQQRFLLPTATP